MIKYRDYSKEGWIESVECGKWRLDMRKSLSIGKTFFYILWDNGSFFFRFFNGYGLRGRDNSKTQWIPFSERYGYVKVYKLFGWTFKILKPGGN